MTHPRVPLVRGAFPTATQAPARSEQCSALTAKKSVKLKFFQGISHKLRVSFVRCTVLEVMFVVCWYSNHQGFAWKTALPFSCDEEFPLKNMFQLVGWYSKRLWLNYNKFTLNSARQLVSPPTVPQHLKRKPHLHNTAKKYNRRIQLLGTNKSLYFTRLAHQELGFKNFPPFSSASPILISFLFAFPPKGSKMWTTKQNIHISDTPCLLRNSHPATEDIISHRGPRWICHLPRHGEGILCANSAEIQHIKETHSTSAWKVGGNHHAEQRRELPTACFFLGGRPSKILEKVPWSFYFFVAWIYSITIWYIYPIYIYHHLGCCIQHRNLAYQKWMQDPKSGACCRISAGYVVILPSRSSKEAMEKSWWCLSINTIQIRLSFCPARSIWNNAAGIALRSVCFPPVPCGERHCMTTRHSTRGKATPFGPWFLETILKHHNPARCFLRVAFGDKFYCALQKVQNDGVISQGLVSPRKRCWGLVNVKIGMIPNFDETFCFGWALNGWNASLLNKQPDSPAIAELNFHNSRAVGLLILCYHGILSKFGPTRLTCLLHQASHNHVGHLVCFQGCCYKIPST